MHIPLLCCSVLLTAAAAVSEGSDAACAAGDACPADGAGDGARRSPHFWPSARGHLGAYSTTHHATPTNLSSGFSWKWFHPGGQYHTVSLGCVIDSQQNVYVAGHDGITKLSPDGQFIWNFSKPGWTFPTVPFLSETSLFGSTHQGYIFSLDLETAAEQWSSKVADGVAGDTGFVTGHDGLVIAGADPVPGTTEKNRKVVAVSASDGRVAWMFRSDAPVWNFMALYPGDGTVVFQDLEGKAYRLELGSGRVIWKAGGNPDTWSDGTQMLGPNGVVYAVSTLGTMNECCLMLINKRVCPGVVYAYRLSDGRELWRRDFDRNANSFLAVGRVAGMDRLAVVAPIGQQAALPRSVTAFLLLLLQTAMMLAGGVLCGAAHRLCRRCRPKACCSRSSRRCAFTGCMVAAVPALLGFASLTWTPVYRGALVALDAETGKTHWQYDLPSYAQWHTAGDPEGYLIRRAIGTRELCLPNPFSAPTIGPDGTVYVGYQDGRVYSVRDSNADGLIDGEREVSTFDTGTAFSSPGAAFAPGMMAIANCDGLFVFKQ